MLGPGRPAKRPSIDAVREITAEEVRLVPKARVPSALKLRDSHHLVARLFALGMRTGQVAEATGYSLGRISILRSDPAMEELITSYRQTVDEEYRAATDEYFTTMTKARVGAMRLIADTVAEAEPGDIPLNQLVAIHADAADRTGYPKRKESVNLNIDFADKLERAVKRSAQAKVIDGSLATADGVLAEQGTVGKASGPHAVPRLNHIPAEVTSTPTLPPAAPRGGGASAAQGKRMDAPSPAPLRLERRFG